ncbi:haloacid dehalogenase-like hydrolase-like protein [Leishmania donovani]|uniref:Haloacid dehalogenase-like hydrolase family protein n=1 Tax=Leishmania donovani TaxID=5661 RepID=A0A3Q8IDX0_LEIDO|nr:haloacid dehalogenase-like hydrolase-like protein [Leishmania donovani]AYU80296.1 haloacid dehalogenase-like hydrolase-like protein [Leishmania donovani]TPP54279.1 haloacid dehalogenase-like hydrolase family protein [Leishmania donovani]CBZ35551.1 haloacid dehalogenase-like hydrolase-like protein [Leishmania donovani]
MTSPFRYVITDMDGTLLSPDHFVSDYTRDTLKTLVHEHGVTPILATGRSYADARIIADNLKKYIWGDGTAVPGARAPASPSRAPAIYLVTSNGATVHNGVTHEVVFRTSIDPALAEKLFQLLPSDEEVVNTNAYQNDDWVCRIDWPEMMAATKESGIRFIHVPHPLPSSSCALGSAAASPDAAASGIAIGDYTGISKIFFITDDAARLAALADEVHAIAKAHGGAPVSLTFSTSDCMDIMANGVTKAEALKKLFGAILPSRDGVDVVADALAHAIAFGDDLNDAEMLTSAGKGCVMGNANPKLIAQHPELEVILTSAEDGVAKKLRSVFHLPL